MESVPASFGVWRLRRRRRCTTITAAATTTRITTASQIGNPPPEEVATACVSSGPSREPGGRKRGTDPWRLLLGRRRGRDGREAERDGGRRREIDAGRVPGPGEAGVLVADLLSGVDGERAAGRRGRHGEEVDGVEEPVVVAGGIGRDEGGGGGQTIDCRATGGRERQLAAGHRVEAREEMARVRLAVGDVGIGGLEPEHQVGLVRCSWASGAIGPEQSRSALRSRPVRCQSRRIRRPGW